jgi:cob(I)alamin adenosyltransferase
VIGLARAAIERTVKNDALRGHVDAMLMRIQNDLFDLWRRSLHHRRPRRARQALRMLPSQTERLSRRSTP